MVILLLGGGTHQRLDLVRLAILDLDIFPGGDPVSYLLLAVCVYLEMPCDRLKVLTKQAHYLEATLFFKSSLCCSVCVCIWGGGNKWAQQTGTTT